MKGYKKLTIITASLGLIISVSGLFLYFFVNSLGIPLLGLFFAEALFTAITIIAINLGALVVVLKIKNLKVIAGSLFASGVLLFVAVQFLSIPSLILFTIAGILALKENKLHIPI